MLIYDLTYMINNFDIFKDIFKTLFYKNPYLFI